MLQTRKPGSGVQVGASDLVPRGTVGQRAEAVQGSAAAVSIPGGTGSTTSDERTDGSSTQNPQQPRGDVRRTSGLGPWSGSVVVLREQPWQEVLEGQRLGRQRYTCAIARPALPRGFCSVLGATARYRRQLRLNTAKRELAGPGGPGCSRAPTLLFAWPLPGPAGSHLAPWRSRLRRVVPAETTRISSRAGHGERQRKATRPPPLPLGGNLD